MGEVGYLVLFLLVLAVNLLPAFGPPTWSLLVYARLRWHLEPVALVLLGASAAASGRFVLASGTRIVRFRFSEKYRANLADLQQRLTLRRKGVIALAVLFVISPLPSAQLFCAAGLLDLRLVVLTASFFVGRLVTYSLYVTTAVIVDKQLGSVLTDLWGAPWWIALQVVMLVMLATLPMVPWGGLKRSAH